MEFYKYDDSPEVWDSSGHHYSSMEELQKAGGTDKIQTISKPLQGSTFSLQGSSPSIQGSTPNLQPTAPSPQKTISPTSVPATTKIEVPKTFYKYSDSPEVWDNSGTHYSSWDQLLKANGGKAPNIQTIEKPSTVDSKGRMIFDVGDKPLNPPDLVRTPSSTPFSQNPIKATIDSTLQIPRLFVRGVAEAGLSAAQAVLPKDTPDDVLSIQPKSGIERFILGDDKLEPLATKIANLESQGLKLPLAFALVIGSTTADILPFGGPGESISKEVVAHVAEQEAKGLARDAIIKSVEEKFGKDVAEQVVKKWGTGTAETAAKDLLPEVPKKDSLLTKLKDTLTPIKGTDEEAQAIYREWANSRLVAKESANVEAKNLAEVPAKEGWQTILKYEKGEATPFTNKIQQTFDNLHNEAVASGLDVPYRENYVPQMYKNSPQEVTEAVAKYMKDKGVKPEVIADYVAGKDLPADVAKTLKLNPSFTKQRVLPNYETATKYGLSPKYTHPGQLAAAYRQSMEEAVANRKLLNDLISQGKLVSAKQAGQGFKAVDLNFAPKGLYAEPKLATALNNIARDEANLTFGQAVLKNVAKTAKFMQELVLSAGFPGTDINFFSMGQLIKEVTAGKGSAVSAFVRANFDKASINFFERKAAVLEKMAANGIDLSQRIGVFRDMYKNMEASKTWREALGAGWDKAFNKKTFASFMPQLYVNTYEGAYKAALKKGLGDAEAQALAADITRSFHGLTENVARGKGTEDALAAGFFAPKFREGIINTLWNTGKSVTTEIANPAFKANRKLAAGMLLTYGAYQYLNKQQSGHYTWDNEPGHEFDLRIPLPNGKVMFIPFMPSFMSLPRNLGSAAIALAHGDTKTFTQKASSLLSMPLQITSQIMNNQDYFGNDIYKETDDTGTKVKKLAEYLGLQESHPYLRLVKDYIDSKTSKDFQKPLIQSLINAAEFPIKIETMDRLSRQQFYSAIDRKAKENAEIKKRIQPIYDQVQQLKDSGDEFGAQQIVDGLSDEDYKIYKNIKASGTRSDTINTEAKIYQIFDKVQQLKVDGSDAEAQKIVDGLSDDEYHAYSLLKQRFANE